MSFFGFDPTGHNTSAPGFSQASDPFAGLSNLDQASEALDFEDTYDGLGDNLEETGDDFNDDTFGGGGGGDGGNNAFGSSSNIRDDFDFFGQTAKVAGAMEEEHARFNRLPPTAQYAVPSHGSAHMNQGPQSNQGYGFFAPASSARPARTGYEKYKEPEPELQVNAALWGVAPKKPTAQPTAAAQPAKTATTGRKILSLEEVEAAMRQSSKATSATASSTQALPPVQNQAQEYMAQPPVDYGYGIPPPEFSNIGQPISVLQHPPSQQAPASFPPPQFRNAAQGQPQQPLPQKQQQSPFPAAIQPVQILQNPHRQHVFEAEGFASGSSFPGQAAQHQRQQSSYSMPPAQQIITHPSQLANLSDEDKAAILEQEAKRAKRHHKIFTLSKDNGLMTPQDKNFVTRIQLQQLVSAAGNPNEHGTDEALRDDFYYQVLSQIRGSTRQHPSQPLNNFAQTYLFQTGSRFNSRRFVNRDRGPENHMQRMEQQVQRAVEAAKNRPKNKQLVIEGTLGKISFSNAKTPKPLLSIKRAEPGNGNSGSADVAHRPGSASKAHHHTAVGGNSRVWNRKSILTSIENVYLTLMELEDCDRKVPPPVTDPNDLDLQQRHVEWAENTQRLSAQLWNELKVHEPIGEFPVHPFIAILSFPKGKKAIPRVFRHLTHEQRATILTMIVVHLDQLDIVCNAQVNSGDVKLNAALRESIELFSLAVIGTLFNFMNDLSLDLVTGVLGLITNLKVDLIAKSRIGASVLTMILSRAEIIKQAGGGSPQQWQSWDVTYSTFFNVLEPTLPYMFPGSVSSGEDMYVWQLLAALGIGANPDQQQRLVLAVKDRVMDTVAVAKTLPVDLSTQRLQSVNLFMRSIGLDVDLLQ